MPSSLQQVAHDNILELEFQRLAETWKKETGHYSLVERKFAHPAYLQIVGLGEKALPLLINEIKKGQNHWFHALRSIGGENPVPKGADFDQAVECWVRWWDKKKLSHA